MRVRACFVLVFCALRALTRRIVKVVIEHSHGPSIEVTAGKAVYLAKGERVRWVFPEGGAEYVPICIPGFTPGNVHREDDGPNPPPHDKHTDIYHMVQTHNWQAAKGSVEKMYYPPTYKTDGFTHATGLCPEPYLSPR